jgi:hypothetical protein
MNTVVRHSIWLGRIVLGAATLLLAAIARKYITDPIGAVGPEGITLGSPAAITIMRVSGGVFLGIAICLAACLTSERRLLAGLGLLATIATTILALRLYGLAVDGLAPFTIMVLKPEIALVLVSAIAFVLEQRRRRAQGARNGAVASLHPTKVVSHER